MTITYVGRYNEYYENDTPFAMICWDENTESINACMMYTILRDRGYDVQEEDEMMVIHVDGKHEYRAFVNEYKEIKKRISGKAKGNT